MIIIQALPTHRFYLLLRHRYICAMPRAFLFGFGYGKLLHDLRTPLDCGGDYLFTAWDDDGAF